MEKNFQLFMNQSARPVQADYEYNAQLLKKWDNLNLYEAVNSQLHVDGKQPFVFVDGPPYANGGAHLGHVLNKVWKDVAVKSQWFLGREVQWMPGWDCHGLPLELQVDKKYPQASLDERKHYCKQLALRSVAKQKKDFKAMGVHADWHNPYLTLSEPMRQASWNTLAKMYEQDLLQYKRWPVHHCPACGSSLAEAELEYANKERDELYLKYKLSNGHFALVWTTTPWTLPMNQALAFHQDFSYDVWNKAEEVLYVDSQAVEFVTQMLQKDGFVKSSVQVNGSYFNQLTGYAPLSEMTTPVLHADFVEAGQTGFVHVAMAHGVEDYELGQKHALEPLNLLDEHGRYLENPMLMSDFYGKKNSAVASLVVDKLKEANTLVLHHKNLVEQAHCWRHKTKVYYQATWQVFLDLEKLKPRVAQLLANGTLSNEVASRLEQMLLSRPHWCLSRQRYWGTALNVLVDKKTNILSELTREFLPLMAQGQYEKAQQFLNEHPEVFAVQDVLDVWFDSGNVVQALGNLYGFEQADLVLEGKDQYRGWFQSLLWMQAVCSDKAPYKKVLVHGFVLDDKKMKFSKSSNNGVTAKEAVEQFGPDVLRLWACMQEENTDAVFSDKKLVEAKTHYQRLRLSLRFLSSNAYDKSLEQHESVLKNLSCDKDFDFYSYAMNEANKVYAEFASFVSQQEYKKALQCLYYFCDKFLSQYVFEVMKQPLYLKASEQKEKLMAQCASYELVYQLMRMCSVFCPFAAEEFFEQTAMSKEYSSVFLLPVVQHDFSYQEDWQLVQELRKMVHLKLEPMQQQKTAKSSSQLACHFTLVEQDYAKWVKLTESMNIQYWLGVSEANAVQGQENTVVLEPLHNNDNYKKCPRCWNYAKLFSFVGEVCEPCSEHVHD